MMSRQELNERSKVSTLTDASDAGNNTTAKTESTSVGMSTRDSFTSELPLKRIKLDKGCHDASNQRKIICEYKRKEMCRLKDAYKEHLTELFFLQNGGNAIDYFMWKKRPSPQLLHFLKSGNLDNDEEHEKSINNEVKVITTSGSSMPLATPVAISTTLPPAVTAMQQQDSSDQPRKLGGRHGMVFGRAQSTHPQLLPQRPGGLPLSTTAATTTVGSPPPYTSSSSSSSHLSPTTKTTSTITATNSVTTSNNSAFTNAITDGIGHAFKTQAKDEEDQKGSKNPLSPTRHGLKVNGNTISAVYENAIGSQEAIVERAKQEAQVMQRVAELRKEGLWSSRRLPRVQEPARNKAHWDYLLEEMQWLAADFAQERKWKKAGARKISRMIAKYHQEQQQKEQRAEKEEGQKLKKIAGNMAKMVREFWSNIEKVVQYKQQSRLEEKRKKALDLHLNFIMDQTEKYSSWLTEGLGSAQTSLANSSHSGSIPTSPSHSSTGDLDVEFKPTEMESDDEETIEKEENLTEFDEKTVQQEISDLQKEGEIPIEDLINSLPNEVLEQPASLDFDNEDDSEGETNKDEFRSDDETSEDDEETICEQEDHEGSGSNDDEIKDLEDEGELSIEELRKKYADALLSDFVMPVDETDDDDDSEDESEEEMEENETEDMKIEVEPDVGVEYLMDLDKDENKVSTKSEHGKDLTDIAAAAESIQPTGYTLETTSVKTEIPFLLKHTLREYQHVGLNWLATLHERRLNGILADEMGLGKTIQTIAVLAHLACEHGIWGPHLIVVPTSVMLNWEMELKKWCPAFKILTYYGNQKERKLKRQGWTKTNAFHVCITSYKLVIQDHQAFRRKKWKYLILDEAQNIKNFKSQRWQTLLNFQSLRRLLLTGTPLQNSLMELWSLMHFLMPHVFQSHREFKEWFANPLSGMIEGSHEYNEGLIRRLHKVLRPFLLRRLKQDVEKQMPKKFEHVVMCRLSKRQRFLYDEFMLQTGTKETLSSGHFMSIINILMQLRKVCNHPNLFDPRPIVSPFEMEGLVYNTPSLVLSALRKDPLEVIDLETFHPSLAEMEIKLTAFAGHRIQRMQTPRKLIEEIESHSPDSPILARNDDKKFTFSRSSSPMTVSPVPGVSGRSSPITDVKSSSPSPITFQSHLKDLGTSTDTTATSSTVALQLPKGNVSANTSKPVVRVNPFSETASDSADISTQSSISKHPLFMHSLEEKRRQSLCSKLMHIANLNQQNCSVRPIYGQDLRNSVNIGDEPCTDSQRDRWKGQGYVHCLRIHNHRLSHTSHPEIYWKHTDALSSLVHTPESYFGELKDILERYVFCIPSVCAPRIQMRASHPSPSLINREKQLEHYLHAELSPRAAYLHSISTRTAVQFPEARLIQYDCGKLQTLDTLLRRLKSGQHRVLIFTQMTRMLDVLEAFLNFHGHRYLRLDGTTKVEKRQVLMDRFNMDKRIFVFILSTRSGGIGVNLTGADTVIFYDSDWNPTMDAQAQDRCHRIGQTRDVHIYRLISEKTVEENILKKANQKRLLGDVAIEGGNFTTAFFKQQTIKELFEEPSGLENFVKEHEEQKVKKVEKKSPKERSPSPNNFSEEQIEQALGAAEDETDVQAAKVARAEQKAELAEFDETIPWDEREAEQKKESDMSRVEHELNMLEKELTPVERYAVVYFENQMAPFNAEELEMAEEEVVIAKEEWELTRLKALKEEEERRAELEDDDMLYTYSRDESFNQVKKRARALYQASLARKEKTVDSDSEINSKQRRSGRVPKRRSSTASIDSADSDKEQTPNEAVKPKKMKEKQVTNPVLKNIKPTKEKPKRRQNNKIDDNSNKVKPIKSRRSNANVKTSQKDLKPFSPVKKLPSQQLAEKLASLPKPTNPALQPWSNPNLVIRTRRARLSDNKLEEDEPRISKSSVLSATDRKIVMSCGNSSTLSTNAAARQTKPIMLSPRHNLPVTLQNRTPILAQLQRQAVSFSNLNSPPKEAPVRTQFTIPASQAQLLASVPAALQGRLKFALPTSKPTSVKPITTIVSGAQLQSKASTSVPISNITQYRTLLSTSQSQGLTQIRTVIPASMASHPQVRTIMTSGGQQISLPLNTGATVQRIMAVTQTGSSTGQTVIRTAMPTSPLQLQTSTGQTRQIRTIMAPPGVQTQFLRTLQGPIRVARPATTSQTTVRAALAQRQFRAVLSPQTVNASVVPTQNSPAPNCTVIATPANQDGSTTLLPLTLNAQGRPILVQKRVQSLVVPNNTNSSPNNTVPILEKMAMQLSGNTAYLLQPVQQRTGQLPTSPQSPLRQITIVQSPAANDQQGKTLPNQNEGIG